METSHDPIAQAPLQDDGAERRLHPWSWLFVLGQQLRQFIVPLVALMIFGGRGDRGDFWMSIGPMIAVGALMVISVLQYFTYRYRVGKDGLTIRDGLLARNLREIPYSRIHNVVLHQSMLQACSAWPKCAWNPQAGRSPKHRCACCAWTKRWRWKAWSSTAAKCWMPASPYRKRTACSACLREKSSALAWCPIAA